MRKFLFVISFFFLLVNSFAQDLEIYNLKKLQLDSLMALKSSDQAIVIAEALLPISETVFGDTSQAYILDLNRCFDLFYNAGMDKEALSYKLKIKEIQEKNLKTNKSDFFLTIIDLMLVYSAMGEYIIVDSILTRYDKDLEKLLNEDNLNRNVGLFNMSQIFSSIGHYDKALKYLIDLERIISDSLTIDTQLPYYRVLNEIGSIYFYLGNYDNAEYYMSQALDLASKSLEKEDLLYLSLLNDLATVMASIGKNEEAVPLMEEVVAIRKKILPEGHENILSSLSSLSVIYHSVGKLEQAYLTCLEAYQMSENHNGQDGSRTLVVRDNLTQILLELGKFSEALELSRLNLQLTINKIGKNHQLYALRIHNLAGIYQTMGNLDEALKLQEEALQLREKLLGKDHSDYQISNLNYGTILQEIGKYKEAISAYLEVEIYIKNIFGETHPVYLSILSNLSSCYKEIGQYQQAIDLLQRVDKTGAVIFGPTHQSQLLNVTNLAAVYEAWGKYEKAEKLLLNNLVIRDTIFMGKNHQDYFTDLNNLAGCYKSMGKYEKAIPLFEKSLEVAENLWDNSPQKALALENLAGIYQALGQYEKAIPLYENSKAIRFTSTGDSTLRYATLLSNMGTCYASLNQFNLALTAYNESEDIHKAILGETHNEYAYTLLNKAYTLANSDPETTLLLLLKTLSIFENNFGKEHYDYFIGLYSLGAFYRKVGNFKKAIEFLENATFVGERVVGQHHPKFTVCLLALAESYELSNLPEKAVEYYSKMLASIALQFKYYYPVLSEIERIKYLATVELSINSAYNFLHFFKGSKAYIEQVAEFALSLNNIALAYSLEIKSSQLSSEKVENSEEYAQFQFLRREMENSVLTFTSNTKIDSLQFEMDKILRKLELPEAFNQNKIITNRDLLQKIDDKTIAINIINFPLRKGNFWSDTIVYYAFVYSSDYPMPELVYLCQEKDIRQFLVPGTTTHYTNKATNAADLLFEAVWAPLQPYLKGKSLICLAPTGWISRIAFEALPIFEKDSKYLSEKFQFQYFSNLRNILYSNTKSGEVNNGLLIGGVDYGGFYSSSRKEDNFYTLPWTLQEVEFADSLLKKWNWQSIMLKGRDASEENLRRFQNDKSPQVLHLATHGYYLKKAPDLISISTTNSVFYEKIINAENPLLKSGIVLWNVNEIWQKDTLINPLIDGVLSAHEISGMDFRKTHLVILSACETGLGELHSSEGVFGLQRAFKLAGANETIVSLWSVSDKETSELMNLFYMEYVKTKDASASLRIAKKIMQQEYPENPALWAGFILIK